MSGGAYTALRGGSLKKTVRGMHFMCVLVLGVLACQVKAVVGPGDCWESMPYSNTSSTHLTNWEPACESDLVRPMLWMLMPVFSALVKEAWPAAVMGILSLVEPCDGAKQNAEGRASARLRGRNDRPGDALPKTNAEDKKAQNRRDEKIFSTLLEIRTFPDTQGLNVKVGLTYVEFLKESLIRHLDDLAAHSFSTRSQLFILQDEMHGLSPSASRGVQDREGPVAIETAQAFARELAQRTAFNIQKKWRAWLRVIRTTFPPASDTLSFRLLGLYRLTFEVLCLMGKYGEAKHGLLLFNQALETADDLFAHFLDNAPLENDERIRLAQKFRVTSKEMHAVRRFFSCR